MNMDEIRRGLGLLPDYAEPPRLKEVKVAVLDSGFAGVGGGRPYLPQNAILVEHYDRDFIRRFGLGDPDFARPFVPGENHGRLMAQLVWATTGSQPDGPQFLLLNANGPTLFRRAVRYAIEAKVDIIVFSGTFDGAGNYDGRGPLAATVDAAAAAGIIWVNAAGNMGGRVYNGPVNITPDGFLRFPNNPHPTALRFTNRFDENPITITLTWNDYRETEDAGTDKDLDLIVEDATGRVVGESKLTQVPAGRVAGEGETKNPREKLTLTDLPGVVPGEEYRIRVFARGNTFGPRDRIRVLLSAAKDAPFPDPRTGRMIAPVEFVDASSVGEVYPPADHPGVLTVGDISRSSAVGPTADGRIKPDVVLGQAVARFSNGEEYVGSSNAAAYFAGVVAVLRSQERGLTTTQIREWVRRLDNGPRSPVAAIPPPPLPAAPSVPEPAKVPLTPNQQRALRYAEGSMTDNRRQKDLPPYIVMSSVAGSHLIQPGGRVLPGDAPPSTPRPAPPLPKTASPPDVVARGASPTDPLAPESRRPHAVWVTPSPKSLADLARSP
jgi:hypothetical protein